VEVYAPALLKLLGKFLRIFFAFSILMGRSVEHDNAYVRSTAAAAFTEAVEHWPVSATETIHALLQLYHEKVARPFLGMQRELTVFQAKILAPEFDQYVRPQLSPESSH
jgi:hypothetical protein